MQELQQMLSFAVQVAQDAGRLTLGYFQSGLRPEFKGDDSPVTVADREAEQLIRSRIADRYPQHGLLGEEFGEEQAGASHRWLIDPIDGTKSFVLGVPLYGVLLGLEIDGEIAAGVAHFPALGDTVWAGNGLGCHWNGRRCFVRDTQQLERATVSFTDAGNFAPQGREEAWQRISAATAYRVGWSDAFGHMLVATGRLDLMLDPIMNPWDCGPFPVLLREAGGYFGDWSGSETVYGGEALSTSHKLLPEVLSLIAERGSGGG
jgi:myo-inositol-1(or 4)-monophosphatase